MRILFVHQNFPGQFGRLSRALARAGHEVAAIGAPNAAPVAGVRLYRYAFERAEIKAGVNLFASEFAFFARRAEMVMATAHGLRREGFVPERVVVHPGWGEFLLLRNAFPEAEFIAFCEYYDSSYVDMPITRENIGPLCGGKMRNLVMNEALLAAHHAVTPTQWQKGCFPPALAAKIGVIHDGIDSDAIAPRAEASFQLPSGRKLTRLDRVVTYAARNLEPTRRFDVFMRAIARIQARHPEAEFLIIGGEGHSYGPGPSGYASWKEKFCAELAGEIDFSRLHFTGFLAHRAFHDAVSVSCAHLYLTEPFVLSWSMLEAMSLGARVIGSDSGPVQEVIEHGRNGYLVASDPEALAARVNACLDQPEADDALRGRARETIRARYDFSRISLPAWRALLTGTMG